MTKRSEEREQFLKDVLCTAVESYGYTPWFQFGSWDYEAGTVKVWHDVEGDGSYSDGPHSVDLDKIATALNRFCDEVSALPNRENTYAWQLVVANRTNGDEGDFDVTTADAVLQIAVLGKEVYA